MKIVIETWWSPTDTCGSRVGCYRAWLQRNHYIFGAGHSEDGAISQTLTKAKSQGYSGNPDDYEIVTRPSFARFPADQPNLSLE